MQQTQHILQIFQLKVFQLSSSCWASNVRNLQRMLSFTGSRGKCWELWFQYLPVIGPKIGCFFWEKCLRDTFWMHLLVRSDHVVWAHTKITSCNCHIHIYHIIASINISTVLYIENGQIIFKIRCCSLCFIMDATVTWYRKVVLYMKGQG